MYCAITLPVTSAALLVMVLAASATAHDWYSGLRAPDGAPCCDQRDCHELAWSQVRRGPSGALELMIDGFWQVVPFDKILAKRSPNGHIHACWASTSRRLRCVILPPEA